MRQDIIDWITEASNSLIVNSKKEWKTQLNHKKLIYTEGNKYFRVIICRLDDSHKSSYCFIDLDGNIYKASSWKVPAKGIRGNIKTKKTTNITSSTGWLYIREG